MIHGFDKPLDTSFDQVLFPLALSWLHQFLFQIIVGPRITSYKKTKPKMFASKIKKDPSTQLIDATRLVSILNA